MKTKKFSQKLTLNKSTIANLEKEEQTAIKAGYLNTNLEATCYTWCGACYTRQSCTGTCYYTCYCTTAPCYQ
ncbi:MAG: class I lanthipeptide [Acidobacteria bacterium]|jgi:hypothetical protein|nr:class I lanthipeptide [Acidobacteriota bacterium]